MKRILILSAAGVAAIIPAHIVAQENPETLSLNPITVEADPLHETLAESGKPRSVMEKKELQSRTQSTLGETLDLQPGLRSSFYGQGASRPVIRGFAGDRVRILRDGVGTQDVSNLSEDHVVVADPLQAEKIEILRGPETLLFGNSAIGGVVNVIDGSIPEERLGKPVTAEFLGQMGDAADDERTAAGKFRGELGNFNWYLSGFSRRSDDYEIPGLAESDRLRELEMEEGERESEEEGSRGKVENTDTESWGSTVGGSYIWDDGFVGMSFSAFDSDYGVPGHSHGGHEEEEHHDEELGFGHEEDEHLDEHGAGEESVRIDSKQNRVDLRGAVENISSSVEKVRFRVGLSDYEHRELEGGETAALFQRKAVESRVEFIHKLGAAVSGAAGMQLTYDDFSADGEEAFISPTKSWLPALFLSEELAITDTVHLDFGGRIEYVSHDPERFGTESFLPTSFAVGPVWDVNGEGDYTVGTSFSYTERAPTAVELFADGPHLARQIYELGDSGLDEERSLGVDLVFRKNTGIVTGAFTPFFQSFGNYLNLAATSEEIDDLPLYVYEEVEAYFYGFEIESALHFDELFDLGGSKAALEFQLDYVKARNKDDEESLPRIPPLRTIVRGRYDWQEVIQGMVEGVFVSAQDNIATGELATDSYSMLNAEISGLLPIEIAGARLFVRGTNLTDEEARVHSSFLKDLAPLRGRALLFGLRFEL